MSLIKLRYKSKKNLTKAKKRKLSNKSSGFSLIEMAITIAIISIAAQMAVSNFTGLLNSYKVQSEITEVSNVLYEARSLARNLLTNVTISPSTHGLTLTSDTGEVREYEYDYLNITGFSTNTNTLVFTSQGSTSSFVSVQLTIQDDVENVYVFTVYPAIGAIRLN